MNKPIIALPLLILALLISACSKLPSFSECNEAVNHNLLQEVFEKNLQAIEPGHPLQLGFCQLKDLKPQLCDIKVEVSDIKETANTSFSSSCKANVRYSATLRMDDYHKERQRLITEINAKANADLAQSKQYVIQTFEKFGVTASEADLQEGVAKREAAIRKEQETAIARFTSTSPPPTTANADAQIRNIFFNQSNATTMSMPKEPKRKSYYLVAEATYTVTKSNEYLNLNMDELKLVAKGE